VDVGLSTENQWWGPGVQAALLLSDAAAGVPHAFLRTARPLRTPIGDVEGRWIIGGLAPSLYYTASLRDDVRSLSGAALTFTPRAAPGLTVGLARLVLAPARSSGAVLGHAFDVFTRFENLGQGDTYRTPMRSDQLATVFGRWLVPVAGAEVYGEWGRSELPRSLRDLLLAPQNTRAYTFGVAQATSLARGHAVRTQLEFTNLEQSRVLADRPPPPDWYTGRAAPLGFTQRGQPLGAAIGPGSSSQSLAVDYYAPGWQGGLLARRVRFQNDALYRVPLANIVRHDVAYAFGARGGVRLAQYDLRAELTSQRRLNYLFQNGGSNFRGVRTVDLQNLSLSFDVSPRAARRAP
jgi:hypothetical protein